MRVVICGDTHIGAVFGLGGPNGKGGNTRVDDYEKTLNYIVDYTIKSGADVFIQTGDAFESRTPNPEYISIFNKVIKKLSLSNITTAIIMGNHDYKRSGESFTSAISSLAAKDYSNVRIVLEPQIFKVSNQKNESINLALIPYRDRRMYLGKNIEEISQKYDQEVMMLLNSCENEAPIVAVGHNFLHSGNYTDFGGHEILTKIDTFAKCDLIAMGHLHQFKIVRKKEPIVIYTGSMEKINFSDEKVDKYFIDYDTNTKKTIIIKTPVRDLEEAKIDLSDCSQSNLLDEFQNKLKKFNLKDKIVRVKVAVKDSLLPFIKKADIEKLVAEQQVFYLSKILIEPIVERLIKDNDILNQKDDFSMLSAFIDGQGFDEATKLELLSEAKSIMT